jgi:hypothetical protein
MTLPQLQKKYADLRVVAPARTKDGLIAAIYLALDAPEYAASNFDALADVAGDLSWLPPGVVELAWVISDALPPGVQRQVQQILDTAARQTARSARPLRVHYVRGAATAH